MSSITFCEQLLQFAKAELQSTKQLLGPFKRKESETVCDTYCSCDHQLSFGYYCDRRTETGKRSLLKGALARATKWSQIESRGCLAPLFDNQETSRLNLERCSIFGNCESRDTPMTAESRRVFAVTELRTRKPNTARFLRPAHTLDTRLDGDY